MSYQTEIELLNLYGSEIGDLIDALSESDTQTAKHIQSSLEQKMQIYWKHICEVKSQFPDDPQGQISEAKFYGFQALIMLFSAGLIRRMSDRSESVVFGLASGLFAKQQEKQNARHSLQLLEKAISIWDAAMFHTMKAYIHNILGEKQAAVVELDFVIRNYPEDEEYVKARRMKDELEAGPRRSGIGSFTTNKAGLDQTLPAISLGTGVVALITSCCYGGIIFGIPAVVLGFLGFNRAKNEPDRFAGSGIAIAGIAVGGLTCLFNVGILVFAVISSVRTR